MQALPLTFRRWVHTLPSEKVLTQKAGLLRPWLTNWWGLLKDGWQGHQEVRFTTEEYWSEFYEATFARKGTANFEWGGGETRLSLLRLASRVHRELIQNSNDCQMCARILHAGCGTSSLGALLSARGHSVVNCDFSAEAVGLLQELHSLGLLIPSFVRSSPISCCEFYHCNILEPPKQWEASFSAIIDKGLLDTLLFGKDEDAVLLQAVRYGEMVDYVLRNGGMVFQISDTPIQMRQQLFEVLLDTWSIKPVLCKLPGSLSMVVAQKPQFLN